ncbi:MAG: tRNA pseudouridine(55) synthase TruB [Myxococcales bacterium]
MDGVLVIDKPEGPTSFDVVRTVRRALKTSKVGHTGTLDPMATGVLPVCLGDATRIAQYLTEGDKTYEALVRLGAATDTQDRTGRIIAEGDPSRVTPGELEAALDRFRGEITQVPPMYSAVKIDGKRLYELARAGKEVERSARKVTIYEAKLLALELPAFRLRVHCSKGTFIRTLAHDLGELLGCHAHLGDLRRVGSGPFRIEQAVPLSAIEQLPEEQVRARLVGPRAALSALPELVLDARAAKRLVNGQRPGAAEVAGLSRVPEGAPLRIVDEAGTLIAIGERAGGLLRSLRVLSR